MAATFQFVDKISPSAGVRLDLNSGGLRIGASGIDLSPPPMRRAIAATMITHGDLISAAVFGNRTVKLPIQLVGADSADEAAALVQPLSRELFRPRNFLRVALGTQPYYFRTYTAGDYGWQMIRLLTETGACLLEIPAEPFALGERVDLGAQTVYADPARVATANANPYFETNLAGWTGVGSALVQSSVQFHEGANSMRLTPDGVAATVYARADDLVATPGQEWQATCWLRPTNTRAVGISLVFKNSAGATISTVTNSQTLTAVTWAQLTVGAIAPLLTASVEYRVALMTGAPVPAGDITYIDEAIIGAVGATGSNGNYFDVTGVKGDVETPLFMEFIRNSSATATMYFATSRRGNPVRRPFVVQVEALSVNTDTTKQNFDAAFSGGGSQNWARCTFATTTPMASRFGLNYTQWPLTTDNEIIGQYRVFVRVRRNDATATAMQMRYTFTPASSSTATNGPTVTSWTAGATEFALVDLGLITIPSVDVPPDYGLGPSGDPLATQLFDAFSIQAARISGSANLDFDYVLFVPADDRTLVLKSEAGTPAWEINVDGYNEQVYARYRGSGDFADGTVAAARQVEAAGGFPLVTPGSQVNRIYYLSRAQHGSHIITGSATVRASYWPRYLNLRPATS